MLRDALGSLLLFALCAIACAKTGRTYYTDDRIGDRVEVARTRLPAP